MDADIFALGKREKYYAFTAGKGTGCYFCSSILLLALCIARDDPTSSDQEECMGHIGKAGLQGHRWVPRLCTEKAEEQPPKVPIALDHELIGRDQYELTQD